MSGRNETDRTVYYPNPQNTENRQWSRSEDHNEGWILHKTLLKFFFLFTFHFLPGYWMSWRSWPRSSTSTNSGSSSRWNSRRASRSSWVCGGVPASPEGQPVSLQAFTRAARSSPNQNALVSSLLPPQTSRSSPPSPPPSPSRSSATVNSRRRSSPSLLNTRKIPVASRPLMWLAFSHLKGPPRRMWEGGKEGGREGGRNKGGAEMQALHDGSNDQRLTFMFFEEEELRDRSSFCDFVLKGTLNFVWPSYRPL